MVLHLHSLHELRLTANVQIVAPHFDAGSDNGLTMEPEWSDAVEEEPGLAAEVAEGVRVGGVRGEDGDGRWWVRLGCPGERLGEFVVVTAGDGEGEREGWVLGVDEFEGFPDDVFSGEA